MNLRRRSSRRTQTLRYIARFRNADGHGHGEIVIVAHLLAAPISGDILNCLHSPCSLEEGSPFHQAAEYRQSRSPAPEPFFFPYLYDWTKSEPDNGIHPLPGPHLKKPPSLPDARLPFQQDLGLKHWVGADSSGDCVGRSL